MDVCKHLSPTHPVLAQEACDQKDPGDRNEGSAWAQQYGISLTKVDLTKNMAEGLSC